MKSTFKDEERAKSRAKQAFRAIARRAMGLYLFWRCGGRRGAWLQFVVAAVRIGLRRGGVDLRVLTGKRICRCISDCYARRLDSWLCRPK